MDSSSYSTPSTSPQDLIRVSCAKIVVAKQEKGGGRLHKNLLVLHLLKKARDSSTGQESRMSARGRRVLPLEHYVNDENDFYQDTKPLAVAREAVEEETLSTVRSSSVDRKRSSTPSTRSTKKRVIPSYLRPLTVKS